MPKVSRKLLTPSRSRSLDCVLSDRAAVNRTVQRFAVLTCLVALLPITVGALVTTLKAGMAFADWPTSDGQNMLLYPWLNDLRHTDKFVEHGHRLAGMLIGFVSIAFVAITFWKEPRGWVRLGSVLILVAVISQGLLGGMRVLLNQQVLAMTHSITGGLFFTLCFVFALMLRATEKSENAPTDTRTGPVPFAAAVTLPAVVLGQYVLGGMFRHLHTMLYEHLAGAVIVTVLSVAVSTVLVRSELSGLRRGGRWLMAALGIQILLGLGSWVTKLGVPALGWVASVNSPAQNVICSLHTVGGMFLLATSTAAAWRMIYHARSGQLDQLNELFGSTATRDSVVGGAI